MASFRRSIYWIMFWLANLHVAREELLTGCLGQDKVLSCPKGDAVPSNIFWYFMVNGSMDNLAALEVSGKEHYPIIPRQFLGRLKLFPNGSLLIKSLTVYDSGNFMCSWRSPTAPYGTSPNTSHVSLNVTSCDQTKNKNSTLEPTVPVTEGEDEHNSTLKKAKNKNSTLEPTVPVTEGEDEHNSTLKKESCPTTKKSPGDGMIYGGIVLAFAIGVGIGVAFEAKIRKALTCVWRVVRCRHQQQDDSPSEEMGSWNKIFRKGDLENGNEL